MPATAPAHGFSTPGPRGDADTVALERPVLTVTGSVGLLLGSVAWAVTGQFAAAPLVFIASLATAVALSVVLDGQRRGVQTAAPSPADGPEPASSHADRASDSSEDPLPRDCELNDLMLRCVADAATAARGRGVRLSAAPSDLYLAVHLPPAAACDRIGELLEGALASAVPEEAVEVRGRLEDRTAVVEVAGPGDRCGRFEWPFGHESSPRSAAAGQAPPVTAGAVDIEATPAVRRDLAAA